MKKLPLLLSIIICFTFLTACQSNKALVGNWESSSISLELKKDKSFNLMDNEGYMKGSYRVEKDKLILNISQIMEKDQENQNFKEGVSLELTYKLEKDRLTLSYKNTDYSFTKK